MNPLSERTIQRLGAHVTGASGLSPYRSGPKLVALFNDFGSNDAYPRGGGFPSRWAFAEEKLRSLNGSGEIGRLMEHVFDPLEFKDSTLDPALAADDMNEYLRRDGWEIRISLQGARIHPLSSVGVELATPTAYRAATEEFIAEHAAKCTSKLEGGDFSGAITSARSLCEEVLCDIERQLDPSATKYDGDLPKLWKRVRKLLSMDPEKYREREELQQLLNGLTSVVTGLSGMSNSLGDRHGGTGAKARRHHAFLAVNTVKTLCSFVMQSFALQIENRTLATPRP